MIETCSLQVCENQISVYTLKQLSPRLSLRLHVQKQKILQVISLGLYWICWGGYHVPYSSSYVFFVRESPEEKQRT